MAGQNFVHIFTEEFLVRIQGAPLFTTILQMIPTIFMGFPRRI